MQFTALDDDCQHLAVAGRTGLAHYSIHQRRWRLFGNETQEKDFIVTGGLLWWRELILVGCYNLAALQVRGINHAIRRDLVKKKAFGAFSIAVGVAGKIIGQSLIMQLVFAFKKSNAAFKFLLRCRCSIQYK